MKLLVFDTSLNACSVAILNQGQSMLWHEIAPKRQAQRILSMVQEALSQANLKLADLDAIAYTCGPGSFTGIRIASSVAQGLAFPNQTPVVQISSLAALAQSAYDEHQVAHCLVAVDARVNQIYWAEYQANSAGLVDIVGVESVQTPAAMAVKISSSYLAIGDGWQVYAQALKTNVTPSPKDTFANQAVLPESVLKLAVAKFKAEGGISPSQALPIYLR